MTDSYSYLHLKGPGRDSERLLEYLKADVFPRWRQSGITVWGMWQGLFGVASNEMIVVAAARDERSAADFAAALADAEILEQLMLTPTVRPEGTSPCEKPGLYVFRFFDVKNADVDEIARLSDEAWQTFENTESYQAEPQGLFRQQDLSEVNGRMLLLTWYDGLGSWQTSRRPAPEARENFLRRRELTLGTVALATRLVAYE